MRGRSSVSRGEFEFRDEGEPGNIYLQCEPGWNYA